MLTDIYVHQTASGRKLLAARLEFRRDPQNKAGPGAGD
jgi:hypothetical protein